MSSTIEVVSISDRPDLIPLVTDWLWECFWRKLGYRRSDAQDYVASGISRSGPPQTFVALAAGVPVGTATLAITDLDERPELTPWAADVFVPPEARGRGYAAHLIRAIEDACRDASIATLWLHTHTAERLYTRLGWKTVEYFDLHGERTALMRRDL